MALLQQGAHMDEITGRFEDWLNEPLPDEVTAEVLEMRRRQRIAMENEGKIRQLQGFSEMDVR